MRLSDGMIFRGEVAFSIGERRLICPSRRPQWLLSLTSMCTPTDIVSITLLGSGSIGADSVRSPARFDTADGKPMSLEQNKGVPGRVLVEHHPGAGSAWISGPVFRTA